MMRLPNSTALPNGAHTSQPWRIHELVPDFKLEDVWALPVVGSRADFHRLIEMVRTMDPGQSSSRVANALWALRWKLGELFGWDDDREGLGARVPSLRERLPPDLRETDVGPPFTGSPFSPLYLLECEAAAELANRTMHGVAHLGWVPDGEGGYRGQMAVYVKTNGLFGAAYMAAIKPVRHRLVYPPMMRRLERAWNERRR